MVIFYSYVSLPEGSPIKKDPTITGQWGLVPCWDDSKEGTWPEDFHGLILSHCWGFFLGESVALGSKKRSTLGTKKMGKGRVLNTRNEKTALTGAWESKFDLTETLVLWNYDYSISSYFPKGPLFCSPFECAFTSSKLFHLQVAQYFWGCANGGLLQYKKKLRILIMFPSPDIKKGRGHHVGTDRDRLLQNQAPKSPSSCRLRMWDLWRHTALSTNHLVWASCWGKKIPWIWRITPLQSPRSSKDHMCFNPLGLIPWNSWGKTIFAAQLDEVQWFVC